MPRGIHADEHSTNRLHVTTVISGENSSIQTSCIHDDIKLAAQFFQICNLSLCESHSFCNQLLLQKRTEAKSFRSVSGVVNSVSARVARQVEQRRRTEHLGFGQITIVVDKTSVADTLRVKFCFRIRQNVSGNELNSTQTSVLSPQRRQLLKRVVSILLVDLRSTIDSEQSRNVATQNPFEWFVVEDLNVLEEKQMNN